MQSRTALLIILLPILRLVMVVILFNSQNPHIYCWIPESADENVGAEPELTQEILVDPKSGHPNVRTVYILKKIENGKSSLILLLCDSNSCDEAKQNLGFNC